MNAFERTILFATQDFPPTEGGIARVYADMARGFPPGTFIVSTTRPDGPAGPPPAGVSLEYEPFPMSSAHRLSSLLRWQRDLDRLIAESRPDVLLCGNLRPLGPLCRRLARKWKVPFYVMVHGNDLLAARSHWSGLRSITWNQVFGQARRWIANSEAVRRIGVEELKLPAERSAVILPEVDTELFRPAADCGEKLRLRREIDLPAEETVLVFIGRLVLRKGLDRLMEALALQGEDAARPFDGLRGDARGRAAGNRSGEERPWRLVVAGYGDPAPYRAMADRLGIAERVSFRIAIQEGELQKLLRAADLAVLPSRTIPERGDVEGFGIVYLEAAASGLPVVAGNSGGVVEAVETGVTGTVVDGNDPEAIRRAIDDILADPARRDEMARAARARTVLRFGRGSRAAGLRRIIESDLG